MKKQKLTHHIFIALTAAVVVLPSAVFAGYSHHANNIDSKLRNIINTQGLTGNPANNLTVDVPNIDDDIPQLGMQLFFSKALGGDSDSACVTCHHPILGGGDDLSLPIGVGADDPDLLGPRREHPEGHPTVPRNAPTTFNTILWDAFQFWDGRVESLDKTPGANGTGGNIRTPDTALNVVDSLAGQNLVQAQARFPVTSPEEMRGFSFEKGNSNQSARHHLAARLGGYGIGIDELEDSEYWVDLFTDAFGDDTNEVGSEDIVTEQRISFAIGEYERSQLFVNNPWKAYVEGDDNAISRKAKRGAALFYSSYEEGGANCVACHSGDKFTDEKFHTLAMPQIGKGGRGGVNNTGDIGRANETKKDEDQYAFRTPSLLNVEGTGPYTHDGAYTKLRKVIRHHLNPFRALRRYDATAVEELNPGIETDNMLVNTKPALKKLRADIKANLTPLRPIRLKPRDIGALVAFLRTLTDPCIKDAECISEWIPEEDQDPNGDQLDARFAWDDEHDNDEEDDD